MTSLTRLVVRPHAVVDEHRVFGVHSRFLVISRSSIINAASGDLVNLLGARFDLLLQHFVRISIPVKQS